MIEFDMGPEPIEAMVAAVRALRKAGEVGAPRFVLSPHDAYLWQSAIAADMLRRQEECEHANDFLCEVGSKRRVDAPVLPEQPIPAPGADIGTMMGFPVTMAHIDRSRLEMV